MGVFRKLTEADLMKIVDIELAKVHERLGERGLRLELSDDARTFIIAKGKDDDGLDYGARPLRRSVERHIEDPLSEELLRGAFEGQNLISVDVTEVGDQKRLDFTGSTEEVAQPELAAVGLVDGESSDETAGTEE